MRLLAGTSGYSYKEWKGSFYPEGLPASQMLRFYADRFHTVEINNTFYQMPSKATLLRWAEEVPEAFVFVLKASRRITHEQKLEDSGDSVRYFFENAATLQPKLGPALFQLPPFLRRDLPRLKAFLALVPEGRRVALEFRHASWYDDEVYEALRACGAALCVADSEKQGEAPLVPTASWGYLRLRRPDYDERALRSWAERIRGQAWDDVFVFFKHEDEGMGPKLAARFLELA